jgi:cytochrome c556
MPLRGLLIFILLGFGGHALALESSVVLPDSLGQWYKPQNKRQVWLHTMFGLRRELQAVREYSDEGDLVGVKKWSDKLLKHYRSLSDMVPEWRDEVDLDYAAALEKSVQRGNFKQIKRASKQITQTCRSCHKSYQLLARLRYRTADFSQIKVEHGGKKLRFSRFKTELVRSLNRIKIALSDQHWVKAENALADLQQRLDSFGQTCSSCHRDDKAQQRILGADTQNDFQHL